ncbi:MAG: hypothetical protein JWN04_2050 [Myxococcaceae bacterium]|nr:hypothetical protein [Myxococcaceae bacterium]
MKFELSMSLVLALALDASLGIVAAHAQSVAPSAIPKGLFTVNDQDPEANLPDEDQAAKHPLDWGYLLMSIDERAEEAQKRGDWNAALKYHRAAAKLVPNRAISHALVCKDYQAVGKRTEAVAACATALSLEGATLDDFVNFVHLVTARPGELDSNEVADAASAIEHLKKEKTSQLAGYELQCELSLRTRDEQSLADCSKALRSLSPSAPRTTSFAWALALQRHELTLARKLLREARQRGLSRAVLEKMERATTAAEKGEASDSSQR